MAIYRRDVTSRAARIGNGQRRRGLDASRPCGPSACYRHFDVKPGLHGCQPATPGRRMLDYLDQQCRNSSRVLRPCRHAAGTDRTTGHSTTFAAEPCYQPELDEHLTSPAWLHRLNSRAVRQQTQNPSELPLGRPQAMPRTVAVPGLRRDECDRSVFGDGAFQKSANPSTNALDAHLHGPFGVLLLDSLTGCKPGANSADIVRYR